jgi:hypothetical protein
MHHQQANIIPFVHLLNIQSKAQACKSEAKIMQREHLNCTIFRIFFSLYAVVGEAAISLRRRPARRHLVSTARTKTH